MGVGRRSPAGGRARGRPAKRRRERRRRGGRRRRDGGERPRRRCRRGPSARLGRDPGPLRLGVSGGGRRRRLEVAHDRVEARVRECVELRGESTTRAKARPSGLALFPVADSRASARPSCRTANCVGVAKSSMDRESDTAGDGTSSLRGARPRGRSRGHLRGKTTQARPPANNRLRGGLDTLRRDRLVRLGVVVRRGRR